MYHGVLDTAREGCRAASVQRAGQQGFSEVKLDSVEGLGENWAGGGRPAEVLSQLPWQLPCETAHIRSTLMTTCCPRTSSHGMFQGKTNWRISVLQ